jgi:hypothetical protein
MSLSILGSDFGASVADVSQQIGERKCFSSFIKEHPMMLIGRLVWW